MQKLSFFVLWQLEDNVLYSQCNWSYMHNKVQYAIRAAQITRWNIM